MLTQMTANCRYSIAYDIRYGGFKPDKVDFSVKNQLKMERGWRRLD